MLLEKRMTTWSLQRHLSENQIQGSYQATRTMVRRLLVIVHFTTYQISNSLSESEASYLVHKRITWQAEVQDEHRVNTSVYHPMLPHMLMPTSNIERNESNVFANSLMVPCI